MSARSQLQRQLFPAGIPKLWCPTLSYFSEAGKFDADRIAQHLERLAPHVRGLLVPGSTGEGWEMLDQQIQELLDIVLPVAGQLDMRVLIGILKTETEQVLLAVDRLSQQLKQKAVAGITVCPPKGADRSQVQLHAGLNQVLRLGIPTALYQLPQVTQNEMTAETVRRLAVEHPNFILFKDTSGADRVANSQIDLEGVFTVRGSEQGGYARWLRSAGGNYDGFLLSTANCFAKQLAEVIQLCDASRASAANYSDRVSDADRFSDADRASKAIEHVVAIAFELASGFAVGNAFTNANKAIDHLLVHGARYAEQPAPMLLSGVRLPMTMLSELAARCPELIAS